MSNALRSHYVVPPRQVIASSRKPTLRRKYRGAPYISDPTRMVGVSSDPNRGAPYSPVILGGRIVR